MTYHSNLKFSLAFITLLALASACSNTDFKTYVNASKLPSDSDKYTNVVLILIDDLSHYGVTAYGANRLHSFDNEFTNKVFSTPNIDAIASQGLRVDRAFAYPLCENTRVALMSGKRNDRNYLKPKSLHASDITFGDAFKKAGYKTGLFGKWKQTRGTKEIPGLKYISEFGWDDYAAFDVVEEGQRFINPNLVINGVKHNYKGREDLDPDTGRRWYGPDIVNRHALQFIETNKDQPFFLYYPMILVHDDHKPTPDTLPHSIFDQFPENADYNNKRGDDRYYFPDMIEYMDKMIGKVVEKLKEVGVSENTLIVVMGDNGTKQTFGHVLADGSIYPARKGGNAENGIAVPLVMSLPSSIKSASHPNVQLEELSKDGRYRVYDGLVNVTDIYPTIAEATGVEMPNKEQVDGISFWKQAKGENKLEPRDYIYTWFIGNHHYKDADKHLKYAFNKDFKRYAADKDFPQGRFFDLRSDPLERDGKRVVEKRWGLLRYSGIELSKLTEEQKKAYQELGELLEKHKFVNVESLNIRSTDQDIIRPLATGESLQLKAEIKPSNAQRAGVIWESSNPAVLSVNKFGEIKALNPGSATITIYSWDDAEPSAFNNAQTYLRTGIQASHQFEVR